MRWRRRCQGVLVGPAIIASPRWRCDLDRKHAGLCHFPPDDWPELADVGGWRGLRDGALRKSSPTATAASEPTSSLPQSKGQGNAT